jgi:hypothetical protein
MSEQFKKSLGWLLTLAVFYGCARSLYPPPDEDPTLKFPPFYREFPVHVDKPGQVFELDGVLLRALVIAANEYTPPSNRETQCWEKPESLRYRFIRKDNIIFVEAIEDDAACEHKWIALDSGAAYAIRSDGRILRRLMGSQTGELLGLDTSSGHSVPVPDSEVGSSTAPVNWEGLAPILRMKQDAGTRLPDFIIVPANNGPIPDGGLTEDAPDAGT